jgi:bifunctional DNA-binding transcriptional regulator/antitoxin component of YhaV-PrlF toxin-antitoxin module
VTSQPIAPVIPSRARAGGRAGPVRRLPLAAVPEAPVLPDEVVYGFGRMDMSGRAGDRAIVSVLGWQPGDRLTLTATAGVTIVRRDPGGLVSMPAKPYITIPAALRHRCGLRAGDRVLLAVFPAGTRWPRTCSR